MMNGQGLAYVVSVTHYRKKKGRGGGGKKCACHK